MTPASDEGTAGSGGHSEGSEGRGGSAGLRPAMTAEEWAKGRISIGLCGEAVVQAGGVDVTLDDCGYQSLTRECAAE